MCIQLTTDKTTDFSNFKLIIDYRSGSKIEETITNIKFVKNDFLGNYIQITSNIYIYRFYEDFNKSISIYKLDGSYGRYNF